MRNPEGITEEITCTLTPEVAIFWTYASKVYNIIPFELTQTSKEMTCIISGELQLEFSDLIKTQFNLFTWRYQSLIL